MKRWLLHLQCRYAGLTVAAAILASQHSLPAAEQTSSDILPPPNLRVSFDQHGGDWTQGNCGSRNLQSPININELYVPPAGEFEYAYRIVRNESFRLYNDGRAIYADVAGLDFGGISIPHATAPWYELKRIDIHSPAEHTFRGQRLPLELQLVHAPKAGFSGEQLVTISVLFNTTRELPRNVTWPSFLQQERSDGRGPYKRPREFAKDFNPNLQPFVRREPPIFDTSKDAWVGARRPFYIERFLEGGTFATYRGSETLPPCDERVLWLVRREPITASYAQIRALWNELNETSLGSGNYRTLMPRNQRPLEFWRPKKRQPPMSKPPPLPVASYSRDAITIAKAASDYARELDLRLSKAAAAQAKAFQATPTTAAPQPAHGSPAADLHPPPSNTTSPHDEVWAAKQIAGMVNRAVKEAVAEDLKEVVPAATNLAIGYLRRHLLKKAGFPLPTTTTTQRPTTPTTTPIPAPAPAPALGPRPSVAGDEVVFSFTVLNADYASLSANSTAMLSFENSVKQAIVDSVHGITLTPADLALAFSPGSVVVDVTVSVPSALTWTAVNSSIVPAEIATSVTTALAADPAVLAVCVGGEPQVAGVSSPTVKFATPLAPAPALAPSPTQLANSAQASAPPLGIQPGSSAQAATHAPAAAPITPAIGPINSANSPSAAAPSPLTPASGGNGAPVAGPSPCFAPAPAPAPVPARLWHIAPAPSPVVAMPSPAPAAATASVPAAAPALRSAAMVPPTAEPATPTASCCPCALSTTATPVVQSPAPASVEAAPVSIASIGAGILASLGGLGRGTSALQLQATGAPAATGQDHRSRRGSARRSVFSASNAHLRGEAS